VYDICILSNTHNDIARFEITVNKAARMDVLQAMKLIIVNISPSVMVTEVEFTHQLPSQKQYSLDHKLRMALNKEVLKGLAKAIDCYRIETSFCTKPMDPRDTGPSLQFCVDMKLVV